MPERYASQIRPGTRLSFTIEGGRSASEAEVYATEIEGRYRHPHAGRPGALSQYAGNAAAGRFRDRSNPMHEIPDAIAMPTEAIVPEMGVTRYILYRNGKAQAVEVKTGLRTESSIQIIEG